MDLIKDVTKYALDRDVCLEVEPLNRYETSMINLMADDLKYVKDVGIESLKIHFDTYHANIEEKSFET